MRETNRRQKSIGPSGAPDVDAAPDVDPAAVIFCALGLVLLLLLVRGGALAGAELAFSRGVQRGRAPFWTALLHAVSLPGYRPFAGATLAAVAAALLCCRQPGHALLVTALCAAAQISDLLLKLAVRRPRPAPSLVWTERPLHDFSFPSGHTAFAAVLLGYLALLCLRARGAPALRRAALAVLAAAAALVGYSRVYLGAHWIGDVAGGFLLGLLLLAAAAAIQGRFLGPLRFGGGGEPAPGRTKRRGNG